MGSPTESIVVGQNNSLQQLTEDFEEIRSEFLMQWVDSTYPLRGKSRAEELQELKRGLKGTEVELEGA